MANRTRERRTAHGGCTHERGCEGRRGLSQLVSRKQHDSSPRVIGLTGPSGAGKSTLARVIQELAKVDVAVIDQDWYFMARSECPIGANFCDPRYLQTDEFVRDVTALARGQTVLVPRLDEELFERLPPIAVDPAPVIVLTGMTLLRIPKVDAQLHARYYLDPGLDVIAERKRVRDSEIRQKPTWVIDEEIRWGMSEYEADAPLRARADVEVLEPPFEISDVAVKLLEGRDDPAGNEAASTT